MIELSRSIRQRFTNIAWLHGTDEIWFGPKWMIDFQIFLSKKGILSSEDGLSKDIETEKQTLFREAMINLLCFGHVYVF